MAKSLAGVVLLSMLPSGAAAGQLALMSLYSDATCLVGTMTTEVGYKADSCIKEDSGYVKYTCTDTVASMSTYADDKCAGAATSTSELSSTCTASDGGYMKGWCIDAPTVAPAATAPGVLKREDFGEKTCGASGVKKSSMVPTATCTMDDEGGYMMAMCEGTVPYMYAFSDATCTTMLRRIRSLGCVEDEKDKKYFKISCAAMPSSAFGVRMYMGTKCEGVPKDPSLATAGCHKDNELVSGAWKAGGSKVELSGSKLTVSKFAMEDCTGTAASSQVYDCDVCTVSGANSLKVTCPTALVSGGIRTGFAWAALAAALFGLWTL